MRIHGRKRMVHERIWDSEQVSSLTLTERLLYVALIVGADDEGCFRADSKFWKRKVFYEDRIGPKKIEEMLNNIQKAELIVLGETKKGLAGFHPNWHKYQTLVRARAKSSDFLEVLITNGLSPRFLNVAEEKISKDKQSEVKPTETKRSKVRHEDKKSNYRPDSIRDAIPNEYRDRFQVKNSSPNDFDV